MAASRSNVSPAPSNRTIFMRPHTTRARVRRASAAIFTPSLHPPSLTLPSFSVQRPIFTAMFNRGGATDTGRAVLRVPEAERGYGVSHRRGWADTADLRADPRMRGVGEKAMNWAYVCSGLIALGLLVYLVVALLRAEDL